MPSLRRQSTLGRVMLTVRDATKLLSMHLGIDVVPYAARLMRDGHLPRGGRPIDEWDAAHLVLAVASCPNPFQATDALEELASAPLGQMRCALSLPGKPGPQKQRRR